MSANVRVWARLIHDYERAWGVFDGARHINIPKSRSTYDHGRGILSVEPWLAQQTKIGRIRLLVCGGRDFTDEVYLWKVLEPFTLAAVVIHGAARGADRLAGLWAEWHDIPTEPYPVTPEDWDKHGRKAGFLRNHKMLVEGQPHVVVAFPSTGPGTPMMCRIAEDAGLTVIRVSPPSP